MDDTCNVCKFDFFYKIFILVLLIAFLSFSVVVYYKSLNSMKHKELSGR